MAELIPSKRPAKKKSKLTGSSSTDSTGRATAKASRSKSAESKQASEDFADFMKTAREQFKSIEDDISEKTNRENGIEDLRFYNGDQWPSATKGRLVARRRPVLTINRVKPAARQVINSMRQNRTSVTVIPNDEKSDIRTASIFRGVIRHIEVMSMADISYDTACNGQVISGFGYLRLLTDYATPFSRNQEIYIEPIEDPFTVYLGPARRADGLDRNYAFIVEDLGPIEYETRFKGKSKFAGLNDFSSVGNEAKGWGTKKSIRVAEYFHRTFRKTTVVFLGDGSAIEKDKIPAAFMDQSKLDVIEERDSEIPEVHWCVINGVEKLDYTEWPGMYIPVFGVYGDTQIVDGIKHRSGVIRDSKDAQRQYNYFRSKMTETVALAPTAPWVMAEGQDEGHETEWDSANWENYAVLRYKPKWVSGALAPPPQRQGAEPPIQAMVLAGAQYEQDIKATTQVYDPNLGAKSNEVSGRAQQIRINQGDTGNYTYPDNFSRTQRAMGVALLDLIPKVYDVRDIARIIGEDEKPDSANIVNNLHDPAYQEKKDEPNVGDIKKIYNIGVGQYNVTVSNGPGYLTKRQEAFDMLTKLVNSYPNLMEVGGDVVIGESDIPGAQELAQRLKRLTNMLHPGIIDDPNDKDNADMPPKAKKVIQQLMQMQDQLMARLKEAQDALNNKVLEMQSKERIAASSDQAAIIIAEIKKGTMDTQARLDAFGKIIDDMQHGRQIIADQTADRQQMQVDAAAHAADHSHEQAMQQDQHSHEMGMQSQDLAAAAQQPQTSKP